MYANPFMHQVSCEADNGSDLRIATYIYMYTHFDKQNIFQMSKISCVNYAHFPKIRSYICTNIHNYMYAYVYIFMQPLKYSDRTNN